MIYRNRQRLNVLSTVSVILIIFIALSVNLLMSLYSVTLGYADSQQNTATQIARTFDILLSQIEDSVYSASLDSNLEELTNLDTSFLNSDVLRILGSLRSIHLRNRYLAEVAMVFPRRNEIILSAQGSIRNLDDFTDGQIMQAYGSGSTVPGTTRPRLTSVIGTNEGAYMTIFSPVPLDSRNANAVLIAYIDIQFMFHEIVLRNNQELGLGHTVDVVDNGIIIISTDPARVGLSLELEELRNTTANSRLWTILTGSRLRSLADSSANRLAWTFVTENSTELALGVRMARWFSWLFIFLAFIVFLLGRYLYRSTKTFEGAYVQKVWAQFLTNSEENNIERPDIPGEQFIPGVHKCVVIALESIHSGVGNQKVLAKIEELLDPKYGIVAHLLVPITSSRVDLVLVFEGKRRGPSLIELAESIRVEIEQLIKNWCYLAVSSARDKIESLPNAHTHCNEVLKYKLVSHTRVCSYQDLQSRQIREVYPFEIENKLLNVLSLVDEAEPEIFVQEVFEYLRDPNFRITDEVFRSYVMQFGVAIQRHAFIKLGVSSAFPEAIAEGYDVDLIQSTLEEYVGTIKQGFAQLSEGEGIEEEIVHFIDSNFSDPHLNLNHVAHTLGIHRNQVSKVVQRKTGKHFIDYLHFRRVEYAKQLLSSDPSSISATGEEVGFSYTHHFIRVFKSLEGVTPGQYQQSIRDQDGSHSTEKT